MSKDSSVPRMRWSGRAIACLNAALLHLDVGAPVMGTELVARLADGSALEYVRSVMRADRYKIVLDLVRQPAQRG